MIPSYLSLTMFLGLAPAMEVSTPMPAENSEPEIALEVRVLRVAEGLYPFLMRDFADGQTEGPTFISDKQLSQFMETAQSDRGTECVQTPRLTVISGKPAGMQCGETQAYGKGRSETRFFGTKLNFVATANEERSHVHVDFRLDMSDEPSLRIAVMGQDGSFVGPSTKTMSVSTKVSIPNGRTLVLTGGKTETERRTEYNPPILGEIPYLDRLFRKVSYSIERKQTLVLVTPCIVKSELAEGKNVASACGLGVIAKFNCCPDMGVSCCKGSMVTLAAYAEAAAACTACCDQLPVLKKIGTDLLGTPGMTCTVKLPDRSCPLQFDENGQGIVVKDSGVSAYSTAALMFSWLDQSTPIQERVQATSQVWMESPAPRCNTVYPVTSGSDRLNVADVETLYAAGVSDEVIINQIRSTGSTFNLSTDDLIRLSRLRVHDAIIQAMQNSRPAIMPESIQVIGGGMGGYR